MPLRSGNFAGAKIVGSERRVVQGSAVAGARHRAGTIEITRPRPLCTVSHHPPPPLSPRPLGVKMHPSTPLPTVGRARQKMPVPSGLVFRGRYPGLTSFRRPTPHPRRAALTWTFRTLECAAFFTASSDQPHESWVVSTPAHPFNRARAGRRSRLSERRLSCDANAVVGRPRPAASLVRRAMPISICGRSRGVEGVIASRLGTPRRSQTHVRGASRAHPHALGAHPTYLPRNVSTGVGAPVSHGGHIPVLQCSTTSC